MHGITINIISRHSGTDTNTDSTRAKTSTHTLIQLASESRAKRKHT